MGIIQWLTQLLFFLNNTVVPFIIALAFLFFIWNAFRFFIYGGASEEGRTNAKRLMLYGIGAFVLILGVWAIVNVLVYTFGFQNDRALRPDYLDGGTGTYNGTGGYAGFGSGSSNYSCTEFLGGFRWCSESKTKTQYSPGTKPTIDPNPPPTTNTIRIP